MCVEGVEGSDGVPSPDPIPFWRANIRRRKGGRTAAAKAGLAFMMITVSSRAATIAASHAGPR